MSGFDPRARIVENPFYVLSVAPTASAAEIERAGQTLLGLLALQVRSAATYATPLGSQPRSAEHVRHALAELRDPRRRLEHELWVALPTKPASSEHDGADSEAASEPATSAPAGTAPVVATPWPNALVALGWMHED